MSPSFQAMLHAPLTLFLPSLLLLVLPPAVSYGHALLPSASKSSLAAPFAYLARFCSIDEIYPSRSGERARAAGWKVLVLVLVAAAMAVRWFATAGWDLLRRQGTTWIWDGLMGLLWVSTCSLYSEARRVREGADLCSCPRVSPRPPD
jgi:hypothetical protein